MFDVGFAELVLCFVVALLVLGPQKLPAVARTLGRWTGRARAYVRNFSAELDREAATAELKRDLGEAARALRDTREGAEQELRRLTDAADPAKPDRRP